MLAVGAVCITVFLAGIFVLPLQGFAGDDLDGRMVISLSPLISPAEVDPDAEDQLLDLLNQVRATHGLPSLVMDRELRFAARAHSHDMASRGYFGHGTPEGQSLVERLSSVVRRGLVGENIAIAPDVRQANHLFVASSGHLHNMLEPKFRRVGIGITDAGPMGLAVTEDFAE
jgi:uncharacterized protein YkwD